MLRAPNDCSGGTCSLALTYAVPTKASGLAATALLERDTRVNSRHESCRALPTLMRNRSRDHLAHKMLSAPAMRVIQIALLLVVGISTEVAARPRGGGSSNDRGRLAQVSGGIAGATRASSGDGRGGGTTNARSWAVPCTDPQYRRRVYDGVCVRRCPEGELYRESTRACARRTIAVVDAPDAMLETEAQAGAPSSPGTGRVTGYVGALKVFDSDGALALELAVSDRWMRVGGTLTRFYERQPGGAALTLTVPSLAFGVRLDDSETTRVYLEGGVVAALTRNDPMMMDSSINGVLGGVHAEHSLSKRTTLIGAAKLMGFEDDIRAASLRAGIRYRHVQASFTVLDFNVGPALYGPEIGFGF